MADKHILGVDFGLQHVGLARATTPLAEPWKTIKAEDALEQLVSLITEHHIELVVLGLSEGQMADMTRAFGNRLAEKITVPVVYHDETLSSATAQTKLQSASKKKRQGPDHHYAAAIFLQDYLDLYT